MPSSGMTNDRDSEKTSVIDSKTMAGMVKSRVAQALIISVKNSGINTEEACERTVLKDDRDRPALLCSNLLPMTITPA